MRDPVLITFRGIDRSATLEACVEQHAAKLTTFCDRVVGCHVTLDAPHRHHRHGRDFQVRINIAVPGAELVVKRSATEGKPQDLYAVIGTAFDEAGRVLQDHVRRRRGDVKTHDRQARTAFARSGMSR